MTGRGLNDDAGIFGERDCLAARDPASINCTRSPPVANAGGGIWRASGDTDDGAHETKAGGSAEATLTEGVAGAATAMAAVAVLVPNRVCAH